MTGIYQHTHHSNTSTTTPPSATINTSHKMSGGVRRTVSSANATNGIVNSSNRATLGLNVSKSLCNTTTNVNHNTQLSQNRLSNGHNSKEQHKKLDRSFSEPAEKKINTSVNVSSSSLGPSSRYKTELCRSFAEVGSCKYGDKCQFAHGDEELRTIIRHPKFKTENCKSFHSTGFCPYGPRCHFIHNNDESKKTIMNMQGAVGSGANGPINQRIFEHSISTPLPVTNSMLVGPVSNNTSTSSNMSMLGQSSSFVTTSPTLTSSANLVRPKALSLGSYSLGSSGEISSPSSQSGSPTSLNSFFTEDVGFGLAAFNTNNSLMSSAVSAFQPNSSFSFSPDSAFVSFNSNTNSNSANIPFNSSNSPSNNQKSIFGGSQPTLCTSFSPDPTSADETPISVISSLFNTTPSNMIEPIDVLFRAVSPMSKSQLLLYPTTPDSPVDSVASEIEALKLGEQPSSFSPISSTFSTSSMSNSSVSPPNSIGELNLFSMMQSTGPVANCTNIPRLPTFAKFTTTVGSQLGGGGNSLGSSSPSSNSSIELIEWSTDRVALALTHTRIHESNIIA